MNTVLHNTFVAILAAGTLGGMVNAQAADNFNINVTGIISPAACEANIAGGDIIDYGTIPVSTLSVDEETVLEAKHTGFTITCDSPAKIAYRVIDNRSGTVELPPGTRMNVLGISIDGQWFMGLGTDRAGNKIGGWVGQLASVTTDTAADITYIGSNDNGVTWEHTTNQTGSLFLNNSGWPLRSVSASGMITPLSFSKLNAMLDIQAVIAPASTLDLSQPVTLDGSVTVEMVYL
ncbi:DUF1120 domain-containing protein [Enterobacter cloacae]|uniref:DUF1120 domain-containing protein n=1 Tax=Enterobacter cloacae TaxID=550 RepID=UPI0013D3FF41|nr:DUF1120 domain-containing protein [Enterobacter cloacae]